MRIEIHILHENILLEKKEKKNNKIQKKIKNSKIRSKNKL